MQAASAADVLILGAGPAGLAVAIASAMRGLQVRIVDAAAPPVDKACGEGLLPDALASLAGLGIWLHPGRPIHGIQFLDVTRVAEARFARNCGRGVRRTALHGAMLERAAALGIQVEWKTTLRTLDAQPARFLVGADGGQSRVRAWAGLDGADNLFITSRRLGLRQHFAIRPWSDCVQVYWASRTQAYVTPVGDSEVGVAFVSRRKFSGIPEALESFPQLRERLGVSAATSTPRGALTVTRRLRDVTAAGRVALVGDASGSVDAVTGEGLNLCFQQADALATALARGSLAGYEAAHRATMRKPRILSSMLLALDQRDGLRSAAIAGLARWPGLFQALLHLHAGSSLKSDTPWAETEISTARG